MLCPEPCTAVHEEGIETMKKLLLLLLAVSLASAILSCRDRNDEKAAKAPEFNFRKTTWGMSRDQVKASEDTTPTGDKSDVITFRSELDGIPAIVGYIFDKDKLARAGYLMRSSYEDPEKYIDDYDKVKESMIKIYGPPAQDEMHWKEGEESQDPAVYGKAVCDGRLSFITVWTDGVTMIRERLSGEDGQCKHGLMFESVDLYLNKPAEEKAPAVPSPSP
jgi:uncharacterized lipoprotein YehR (DUF1307 family)